MYSGKIWQLEEVDRTAVNLTKSGFRIFSQKNKLNCSAMGTTSETAEYVCFQGVEFKA